MARGTRSSQVSGAGARRGLAGLERVPVRVLSKTATESLELALIENLQRQDLNAIEEARGYRKLLTEYRMTQAELADKVSKSRSTITNALRLLDLPDEVQELVYEAKMTAGHARAVLSVPDEAIRLKLAQRIVDDGLSVREAENLARLFAAGQTERAPQARCAEVIQGRRAQAAPAARDQCSGEAHQGQGQDRDRLPGRGRARAHLPAADGGRSDAGWGGDE